MKINYFAIIMLVFFLIFIPKVQSQTLYHDEGHINSYYQQTWNVAGLLQDISTITPVSIFVVTGSTGDDDAELATAISDAKAHVNSTHGLAVIYSLRPKLPLHCR